MTIDGWSLRDMGGAPPLPCTTCGREIGECDVYYTPSHIDDWQEDCIRQLYHVDAYADFMVCERCKDHEVFENWLEARWNRSNVSRLCEQSHDWRKGGF